MYISQALVQKHQRRGPKQTGKFSAVLQMFPPTVSVKSRMLGGRLFQIRGPATAKDRSPSAVLARGPAAAKKALSPSDERRVAGTTRVDNDADRSRRRDVT